MANSHRRTFVNLSVFAGSAALFAAAWTGVVGADRAADEQSRLAAALAAQNNALASAPVSAVAIAPPSVAGSTSTAQTQPAPAPTRHVVVVRQSRAS